MQIELERFLNFIHFDSSLFSVLENAKVEEAEYDTRSQSLFVVLVLDHLIDPRVYDTLTNAISSSEQPITLAIKLANKPNEPIICEYYKYFVEKLFPSGMLKDTLVNLPVELHDNYVIVTCSVSTVYEAMSKLVGDIDIMFRKVGIPYEISLADCSTSTEEIDQIIQREKDAPATYSFSVSPTRDDFKSQKNEGFYNKSYERVTISDIKDEDTRIEFEGQIFYIEERVTRRSTMYLIYVTDYNRSVLVKAYESKSLSPEFLKSLKVGQWITVRGGMTNDKYYSDSYCLPINIIILDKDTSRMDDSDEKRVELHLHTKMSAMDAVTSVEDYIKTAIKWGHKAIAITDHGDIQAFPEAQKAAKDKIKVIYGMEGYTCNNKAISTYNETHEKLIDKSYIVFDLETTGLSQIHDRIIECGFCKVVDGQIVDTFQTFVNPLRKLNKHIIELTNITDEMLIGAPTIDEVLPKLLEFMGDLPLVAHNGTFDVGFIQASLRNANMEEIKNTLIDTLPLSRVMYPDMKQYNLGKLCKQLDVGYDTETAHRGDYDATVLARCWVKMISELENRNVFYIDELNGLDNGLTYKHAHPYHMTFLVKNDIGLKNLYKLVSISNLEYITTVPLIPKEIINDYREGLLLGSACFNGELFDIAQSKSFDVLVEACKFYDFIEIQPIDNYKWLIQTERVLDEQNLLDILHDIIKAATEANVLIVATGDCHYLNPEDKIYRDVYVAIPGLNHRPHALFDKKYPEANYSPIQHFRTTKEMIDGISYVGDLALQKKFVIDNTNKIADMIEVIHPVKDQLFTPKVEGIDDSKEITDLCNKRVHELYGENPPQLVMDRMNLELDNIIKYGYAIIYYLAYRLVKKSNEDGYLVGSRGSVGSSFVASLCGITEVNPLAPHYLCPNCHHSEFFTDGSVRSGFDLEPKVCPECGQLMYGNGQNIPFETFLGLKCDKVPDIDLNFSRDYQAEAHNYTKVLCGENNVFRAGTISTVAEKTAFAYARKYYEAHEVTNFKEADLRRLAEGCKDVKRTTGQHPAGIIVIPNNKDVYDFTPIQYPADEETSNWKTTHYAFKAIHDEVLKLDILGHLDPMAIKMLKDLTGVEIEKIPMNDPEVIELFKSLNSLKVSEFEVQNSIGTSGVPEFGTNFVKGVLEEAKPTKFSDLVQISGLTHGTDVWEGNARELIKNGTCGITDVIGCRDDIMTDLIRYGLDKGDAFKIMEFVRHGYASVKVADWAEHVKTMQEHNVPEWYIDSCAKIKYMFPKAHAVAYVVMALRVAWFKVHYPLEYYCAFFSVRCDKFDIATMMQGKNVINDKVRELRSQIASNGNDLSNTVFDLFETLELALEMTARGYTFSNVSLEKSDAINFKLDKENNALIPPFIVVDGLGETVAKNIVAEREKQSFKSKEDLQARSGINQTVIKKLEAMGVLENLLDSSQLKFDLGI